MKFVRPFLLFSMLSLTGHADTVRMTLKVEYKKGSAKVEAAYRPQVKQVADFLKKYPNSTAVIEGHADNIGSDELNKELSERRAQSVLDMLVYDYAIGPARLKAVGYGKTQPVASNATEEGRFQNRRVVANVEAAEDELKSEEKEIDVAKAVAPPPEPVAAAPVAPIIKPAVTAKLPLRQWERALAGPFFEGAGTGFTLDWNPIVHRERGVTFEGLLGLLYQKGRTGAGYFGIELGYFVGWQPVPDLELNAGATMNLLNADAKGVSFSLYTGLVWFHHLFPESFPYFDRLVFAYTPLLVRNANRQALRLSLGFTL